MTIRRLVNSIEGLAVDADPQGIRNDRQTDLQGSPAQTFIIKAPCSGISAGKISIVVGNVSQGAEQATDEPIQPGMDVWAIQADDGTWIVLGSVKE